MKLDISKEETKCLRNLLLVCHENYVNAITAYMNANAPVEIVEGLVKQETNVANILLKLEKVSRSVN